MSVEKVEIVIKDLHVTVGDVEILKGFDLTIRSGEIHALMGPNGSGKTTLAYALAGHPRYEVTGGTMHLNGEDLLELEPDERAKKGVFLCFQYPPEVPGVTVANFLRQAVNSVRGEEVSVWDFQTDLMEKLEFLDIDESFAARYLNEGFSGGEKKRMEMLQMSVMRPRFAILDETDSGLDVDAFRVVAKTLSTLRGPNFGALVITHYPPFLKVVVPDFVHVMIDGRIVRSGGPELAEEIEDKGYGWLKPEGAASAAG